ncbi:ribonuclease [Sphingomonas profundi]|uniref:ribonuclease n=1 Tax=Alterirhizorhabdus profundi TaxID=2681549 RepID=UPI0012E719DC|nr:ribonuclease [Sphingomonas profundi]
MAEWLYEAGIGEVRAALVERGVILEALIEIEGGGPRAGAIVPARLAKVLVPGRRAIVRLEDGAEALLEPIPAGTSEGRDLLVEIVREAIGEPGRPKRAKARPAAADAVARPGLRLRDRLGRDVTTLDPHVPDRLEEAGWSELLEEAAGGEIAFAGGGLRLSLTPAMTLFDVDGTLPVAELAIAGAAAAARAIRRMDIGGSIGIDLPTVESRAARQAAAAAFDAHLPQPFERTAVNGFGFLQAVRRRTRPSLPELLRDDPAGTAARALLRRAERVRGAGTRTIHAAPAIVAAIERRSDWLEQLRRRTGSPLALRADPALAISAGHVQADHPLR